MLFPNIYHSLLHSRILKHPVLMGTAWLLTIGVLAAVLIQATREDDQQRGAHTNNQVWTSSRVQQTRLLLPVRMGQCTAHKEEVFSPSHSLVIPASFNAPAQAGKEQASVIAANL